MRIASGRSTSTSPCNHSAPSCTAHTTRADSVPRRYVSAYAWRVNVSASAGREKYVRLVVWASGSPSAPRPTSTSPNGQRLHFSPLPAKQRHHRPIGAQVLHRWPIWRRWPLAFKPLNLSGLLGHIGGPSGLRVPPHRRFI